ncbi:MAG: two-component sensor histidine kinase [Bacteroidetes bacterium HGW-Bacteroidetes-12]|nr:MAG: two-component sensor histidine kinase [Bacteroidetes bacterium HGW-Bacteroidetes-12]
MNLNIKTKLTLQFTLIVTLILTLFSISIYYFSSTYREKEFYNRLENKALDNVRLLIDVKEIDHDLLKIIDRNTNLSLYNEKVMIFNYKNELLYNSSDNDSIEITPEILNNIRLEKEVRFTDDKIEILGLLYTDKFDRFVVLASAFDKYGRNKLNNLKWVLFIGFFVSIGITVFVGRIYAEKALKPMSDVVSQVEKITISSLNLRVEEGNGTDEISQLAITFNKMLNRLESAFEMQRSFVSNASHELRTPLTSITGEIEVSLMKNRSAQEYESILKSVLEEIKNLNEITNGLLDIAKASSDISAISVKNVRIDELLWQTRSELIARKKAYTIEIKFAAPIDDESKLTILGNEYLLKTAIINLMDNACKYSLNNTVIVELSVTSTHFIAEFMDNGIGIDEEDLKKITAPFFRAKNAINISGNGLGLPLVDKIITLHQGTLSFQSEINKGTVVSISLPFSD